MTKSSCILSIVFSAMLTFMYNVSSAQSREPYMRIAKIVVDSMQLENYKTILREAIATAVSVEPGVLKMYAVYDKDRPTHVTVFEIYASRKAYESHIQTPHFKKYKTGTLSMVKYLELSDVIPIALEAKKQQ